MKNKLLHIIKINNRFLSTRMNKKWFEKFEPEILNDLNIFITKYNFTKIQFKEILYLYLNDICEIPICEICKNNLKKFRSISIGYTSCSNECSKQLSINKIRKTSLERYGTINPSQSKLAIEKRKSTCLEKYGNEEILSVKKIREKIKETNLERYGVEYVFDNIKIKQKSIKTLTEKYGSDNVFRNNEIKQKIKETNFKRYNQFHNVTKESLEKRELTCLEKYGTNHVLQSEQIKEKSKETCLKKYGTEFITQSNFYKSKLKNKYKNDILNKFNTLNIINIDNNLNVTITCDKCNKEYTITSYLLHKRSLINKNTCLNCEPLYYSNSFESKIENEIREFIESLNIETKKDRTILNDNEIDIYIEDYKVGFEVDGVYWHSELYKDDKYHLNKTLLAKSKGVKLVHIWEDDWNYKKDIIKSRIKGLLNLNETIYARKCIIKEVSSSDSREFLNRNHLQGNVNAAVKLGLYYNNELVSLMTLGSLRKNLGQKAVEGEYELLRFANKLNISVTGGASRLFNYFTKEYKPEQVISYTDCDWTSNEQDNLYIKLGFKYIGHSELSYWWVVDGIRENRFKFRKDKLVKEGADPSMTEVEIMHDKGYYRCFGTGNLKFNYINTN